jgi:hypothetical protein
MSRVVGLSKIRTTADNRFQSDATVRLPSHWTGVSGKVADAVGRYGRQSDYEPALDAGRDHHLTKPARPGDLSRLIDGWAAAHPSAAEGNSQLATMAGG